MATPSRPTLFGKELLGIPFSEAKAFMMGLDDGLKVDDAGLTSHRFGVGLYAPYAQKNPEEPVESIIIFAKGYYDSQA
jgi:hypothetical protein